MRLFFSYYIVKGLHDVIIAHHVYNLFMESLVLLVDEDELLSSNICRWKTFQDRADVYFNEEAEDALICYICSERIFNAHLVHRLPCSHQVIFFSTFKKI